MKAVRFDQYGGLDVLEIREVEDPVAGPGRVLVEVRAAGMNPGEISIREGRMHERFPATFPSGEGTDFAGVVREVGAGVDSFAAGEEVLGWSEERSSHAELVAVPQDQLTAKPPSVPWEVAGSLFVADFSSVEKYGVKGEGGGAAASAATLAELAKAIAAGDLVVPIQRTYPPHDVRAAFAELEAGHVAGKIVLIP
jgi:NADPH:quinone reductase-like Zn-dependent oxidoreductase